MIDEICRTVGMTRKCVIPTVRQHRIQGAEGSREDLRGQDPGDAEESLA